MSVASFSDDDNDESSCAWEKMQAMNRVMEEMTNEIVRLEQQLEQLQRPIELLELNQLDDLPFLESSPFRQAAFHTIPDAIPGLDSKRRYPFHALCAALRNYLFRAGAVAPDGTIALTAEMRKLFGIQESHTTYIALLNHLRHVIA